MNITAKEIIIKYLKFKHLVPNIFNLNEEKLKNNSEYYNQFLQLRSIFFAFNLGLVRDFESGSFVRNFPIEAFSKLVEIARENNCLDQYPCDPDNRISHKCLELLFIDLWDWRSRIHEVINLNSEFENIDGINLYAYQQISKVNYLIKENLDIVDQLLAYLVTPITDKISIEKLENNYGYPRTKSEVLEVY